MLPPALDPHEPEPVIMPVVTRAYEHTQHTGPDLIGTMRRPSARRQRLVGRVSSGYTVAAVALSKSYRHITADNWRTALDEISWLMPLMISSFAMAYLGWVVWSTIASINGHRVAPLASSPWLPPVAYLLGPAAAAAGSIYKPELNGYWLAGGRRLGLRRPRCGAGVAAQLGPAHRGRFRPVHQVDLVPTRLRSATDDRHDRLARDQLQQLGLVRRCSSRST